MSSDSSNRLRLAIQKSGRLSEDSLALLNHCGIKIRKYRDQLFCHSENFPLDILYVRDDDIPNLIADGVCDYGIVGTNVLQENILRHAYPEDKKITKVMNLDFGVCRLSIAVPEHFHYENIASLKQKKIVTTYPNLLKQFLTKNNIDAEIIELSGAVEIAPRLGIADAICDLVSTGATLEANNLKETEVVFKSCAVLIKTTHALNEQKQIIAESLQQRLQGVLQANETKYIMLHAPKKSMAEIVKLLPGSENPTIMPLQDDSDKVAVHAVCRESIFWETMEQLKKAGASAILVLPVEKMLL